MELQALIDGLKAHKNGAASYESVDEAIRIFEAMRDVDGEKVVKGLECCIPSIQECQCVDGCPYYDSCWSVDDEYDPMYLELMRDALTLIRQQREMIAELEAAQMARVMSLEDAAKSDVCWLEIKDLDRVMPCRIRWYYNSYFIKLFEGAPERFAEAEYGTGLRCWTQRPTDEQREVTPWY